MGSLLACTFLGYRAHTRATLSVSTMKNEEKPSDDEFDEAHGQIDSVPLPEMPYSSAAIEIRPTPARPVFRPYFFSR